MKSTKSLTFTSSKCLLNQINLKLKQNEFEWIGIACEELLRRCMAPFWVGVSCRDSIVRFGGLELIMRMISIWVKDETLPPLLLKLLYQLLKVDGSSEWLIKNSGMEKIQKIINIHIDDKEIRVYGKALIRQLGITKKDIALKEINIAKEAITYDIPIDIIKKYKVENGNNLNDQLQALNDINDMKEKNNKALIELLQNMKENLSDTNIQEIGIETITILAKKKSSSKQFIHHGGSSVLLNAMNNHNNSVRILWRGCAAIHSLCDYDSFIRLDLGKQGACQTVFAIYDNRKYPLSLRQQSLFAIACLCHEDFCRIEFEKHGLQSCLDELLVPKSTEIPKLVIPLKLRQIHTSLPQTQDQDTITDDEGIKTIDLSKNVEARYGTIDDIFFHGEPGLI